MDAVQSCTVSALIRVIPDHSLTFMKRICKAMGLVGRSIYGLVDEVSNLRPIAHTSRSKSLLVLSNLAHSCSVSRVMICSKVPLLKRYTF
jgi:hypothetical protein